MDKKMKQHRLIHFFTAGLFALVFFSVTGCGTETAGTTSTDDMGGIAGTTVVTNNLTKISQTNTSLENLQVKLYEQSDSALIRALDSVKTDEIGSFAFSQLHPGEYAVAISGNDSLRGKQENILVEPGEITMVQVQLTIIIIQNIEINNNYTITEINNYYGDAIEKNENGVQIRCTPGDTLPVTIRFERDDLTAEADYQVFCDENQESVLMPVDSTGSDYFLPPQTPPDTNQNQPHFSAFDSLQAPEELGTYCWETGNLINDTILLSQTGYLPLYLNDLSVSDTTLIFNKTSNSFATIPSFDAVIASSDSFDMELEFNLSEDLTESREVFLAGYAYFPSGQAYGYEMRLSADRKVQVVVGNGSTWKILTSQASIQPGEWTVLRTSISDSSRSLYINGILDTTDNSVFDLAFADKDIYLGKKGPGTPDNLFQGEFKSFCIAIR